MDETQRVSDATASRKRRSSILKSQRAPRTPFSELEFNVATPTEAGKSRRVSFSRRTGVAEFVTNEATTTWKNFYEEHNKSLESSGNESGANAARPSISHIGKRIFDQQFEEVEAVDFGSALIPGNSKAAEFNISINNINLTQQLAAFECTVDDKKLTAPHQHFELSSLTDHKSKVFGDDLTLPVMGEMSNQINVNFSIMNPIGNSSSKCDDLDEIQKDLERSHNAICPGPFREQNMSEYIEVDLNMTHVAVANDVSDMSITNTIHSPKVQEIASNISVNKSKKNAGNNDWTADKENIAIFNPYVAPRESDNFAINEVPDQVLVFDGKRLTVQSDTEQMKLADSGNKFREDKGNYRRTLLSDAPLENTPQRKTIVLNMNDDLPNFNNEPVLTHHQEFMAVNSQELKNTVIFDEGELSMTQAVPNIVKPSTSYELSSKRKTIDTENITGNISLTQAVPRNVILDHNATSDKRQTVCDSENISFTEVVPANIIKPESQAKPGNRTILFQENMEDISFTQALPNKIHLEKSQNNKTTVFEKSVGNISMTEVLPTNILLDSEVVSNKRKTIVFEHEEANISMTQAIPVNLILTEKTQSLESINKENVVVFENDTSSVNLSQEIPSNIIRQEISEKSVLDIELPKLIDQFPPYYVKEDKNVTILPETVDISIHKSSSIPNKRLTIMYDEHADISMTQALPTNILSKDHLIKPDETKSVITSNEDISVTQGLPSKLKKENQEKSTTQLKINSSLSHDNQDISIMQVESNISNLELENAIVDSNEIKLRNKSVNGINHDISANAKTLDIRNTGNNEISHLSISKPIPNKIFEIESEILKADMEKFTNFTQFGERTLLQDTIQDKSNVDILVYQAKTQDTSKTQIIETDHGGFQDIEYHHSGGIDKINSTIAETIKSTSKVCSDSEFMNEKDFEMQINLQNEELSKECLMVCNPEATATSTEVPNCEVVQDTKEKKSILHELLDMSSTSIVDDVANKSVTSQDDVKLLAEKSLKSSENNSSDAIFVITRDSYENTQIGNNNSAKDLTMVNKLNVDKLDELENKVIPALDYNIARENSLEHKLITLRRSVIEEYKKSPQHNRLYEKILSSDLQATLKPNVEQSNVKDTKTRKSFKEADDTKELLEILSDFTDRKSVTSARDDDKNVLREKIRKSIICENKIEISEPKRLSFAPKRQSIVLSREELLNNLSMAQATLQQSRFEIEDSEIDDTAMDSPVETNESISSSKRSVRMSNEVVKTLHFEDESCSDVSIKSEVKISPLKKTAFGETSYMRDCKANVIPTYLKDVSDNIKALMNDLVKPRPDQMPFEVTTESKTKKEPSTCSTQIQANLITSSQIDLDEGLHSNVNSVYELNNVESLVKNVKEPVNAAIEGLVMDTDNNSYTMNNHEKKSSLKKSSQEPVLVFDHHNPLNNVLLAPPNCVDVHKYDPVKSSEAFCTEVKLNDSIDVDETKIRNQCDVQRVLTQYNIENHTGLQSGDACPNKNEDINSLFSDPSKPLSMDRSTEGFAMEVKSTEVNTVIVMKGNKELLEASSSLTLVDDALTQNVYDVKVETQLKNQKSPVKVIYKIDDDDASMSQNIDSDLVSNDDEPMEYAKTRKRSYSPTRRDLARPSTLSSHDVTPKPISKIQKMSNSPNVNNITDSRHVSSEKSDKTDSNSDRTKRSSRKSKGSPKYKKPGTDVTVQQLITEYKITKMEQDMIEEQIIEAIHDRMSLSGSELGVRKSGSTRSPEAVSSCTSSKGQNDRQELCVQETVSYVGSQPSRVDWQPDLTELSSRNILTECESGVNVVAKIDMLPFMGSKECEWETSGGDTWVFRLLRGRLRLRVRLAHRHHNALRSRVRADTPVTEACVDVVPVEEKDPLAVLCVRFAAEAMRYECGRGCSRAGGVPLLLRRCGGVARVALRWARAMRDARARLAYTLTADGLLTLKVANVPLRSVWEVSMRLELVVEDAREAAWPRAGDVRVQNVLADCVVPAQEAARALRSLSHDWGHAPRTIWKIFRYLKNKSREDDFLRL